MASTEFRNQTGGIIHIPHAGKNPGLEGNVVKWTHVENGEDFSVQVDEENIPINPSLRVLAKADDGIVPTNDAKPVSKRRPKGRRTREL